MSAIKQLPLVEEAIELDNNLVGQGEALLGLSSAAYALKELKEEMENALGMDPTGEKGLLAYGAKTIMHKLRNVNFLIQAHSEELQENYEMQQQFVNTLLQKVEGDKGE